MDLPLKFKNKVRVSSFCDTAPTLAQQILHKERALFSFSVSSYVDRLSSLPSLFGVRVPFFAFNYFYLFSHYYKQN